MRYHHLRKPKWHDRIRHPRFSLSYKLPGRPDYFLIGLIFVLIIFGLIALSSASSVESFRKYGNIYHLFWRQVLRGFLPGMVLFFLLAKIDYKKWERYTVWFFVISIVLLLLVFMPGLGVSYSPAKSWINLRIFSFQPAEIVKLLLIMSLAGWFSYRGREMNRDLWNGLLPFAVMVGLISLLIILQPDLGTLVVLATIAVAVYFVAGASLLHLFLLLLGGIVSLALLILAAPYRLARLTIFLHPELDPQGIGYHINQAFLAVGSGGWLGLGFGQSRQKFAYLPEVIGDSIFAIIAEELGFFIAAALIVTFMVLVWRGFQLAAATDDDYGKFVAAGIISWYFFQAFYNIGAMIGLLPLTGVPLPFISYGGTAMMSGMAAAGILANISSQTKTAR